MRKKIKQVLCMISALVVMICCAVPAFALKQSDGSGGMKLFIDMALKKINSDLGFTPDSYIAFYSPNRKEYSLIYLVPDTVQKFYLNLSGGDIDTLNQSQFYISNYHRHSDDNKTYRYVYRYNDKNQLVFKAQSSLFEFSANIGDISSVSCGVAMHVGVDSDNGADTYVYYHNAKVYDWSNPDKDVTPTDPTVVPAPFTVTYTPELSLNMQNKIYYPSKGGANADENGLVAAENNNINLDIKLSPEFLKTFNEKDLGKAYGSGTYAVLCCLSKNLLNAGDDLQRFFDEDVVLYAMNHDGNYYKGQDDEKIKSDDSSSDDLNSNDTVDTFEPYLTLYQGRTPIYTIPRDGKITVSFDLTSIDYKTHGLTDDSKLYVNVIGVFVKNNGHVTPQNGEKTEDTNSSTWLGSYAYQEDFTNLKTCEKIDDFVKSVDEETGKPETFKAYRVYSVISDPFSYEKFPDYVPKVYKDKDGNTYNPSTTKLKDLCNIPPSKVTDVDLAKGSDGVINDGSYMQPDDYNKYLDKKKINANFGSVDFTDIKSIFSTTGTYWDFLTAALSCLPSWFYAVFSAWFVLFLAIALIKLVLPT